MCAVRIYKCWSYIMYIIYHLQLMCQISIISDHFHDSPHPPRVLPTFFRMIRQGNGLKNLQGIMAWLISRCFGGGETWWNIPHLNLEVVKHGWILKGNPSYSPNPKTKKTTNNKGFDKGLLYNHQVSFDKTLWTLLFLARGNFSFPKPEFVGLHQGLSSYLWIKQVWAQCFCWQFLASRINRSVGAVLRIFEWSTAETSFEVSFLHVWYDMIWCLVFKKGDVELTLDMFNILAF